MSYVSPPFEYASNQQNIKKSFPILSYKSTLGSILLSLAFTSLLCRRQLQLGNCPVEGPMGQGTKNGLWRMTEDGDGTLLTSAFRWDHSAGRHLDCNLVRRPEPEGPAKLFLHSWPTETMTINPCCSKQLLKNRQRIWIDISPKIYKRPIRTCEKLLNIISLIKELQIKTKMKLYFIPTWMAIIKNTLTSVGKDVEKLEPLSTAGRKVK